MLQEIEVSMSPKTCEILKSCILALALATCVSLNPSLAVESADKKQPVYGTCTLGKNGGEFQTAICLLKQLCPTCDFGTLSKSNIKIIADDHVVDRLFITTYRQQSYGLISTTGKVEARVMFGVIDDLCLKESRDTTLAGHEFEYKGCVRVAWEGKPRGFVYPSRFADIFKNAKYKIKYVNENPTNSKELTIESLVLTDKASLCGQTFPKNTEIVNNVISDQTPYRVELPEGATLAAGRRPAKNEVLLLTDENHKCDISIRERYQED